MIKGEIKDRVECIRNGIIVFPVYYHQDEYNKAGELKFERNHWYLHVLNNEKLTRYAKSLGKGKVLRGKALEKPVAKTYAHWAKKLNEL